MTENQYEIIALNDSDYMIEDNGVRCFLLQGNEKALLVDSGMNLKNIREIVAQLTDKPLLLFNTHADRDHIAGNGEFEEFYMHPLEEENYRNNNGQGKIVPVKEGTIIDLGERKLEVVEIRGHTPGSCGLIDEKEKVLISGDPIQDGTIFMFGKFRDLETYIEGLEHLKAFKSRFKEIWPSHGTLPVSVEMIDYDQNCARMILNQEAEGKEVEFRDQKILRYDFEHSSFLCGMTKG